MLRYLKTAFLVIATGALLWFAWQSRNLLLEVIRNARPLYLVSAALLWTLLNAIAAVFTSRVFGQLGADVSIAKAANIHVRNLPARYLPGGIWHTVGRVADYRQLGVGGREISGFVFLENALAACTAFLLGGVLLWLTRVANTGGQVAIAAAAAAIVILALLPAILSRFVGTDKTNISLATILRLLPLAILSWSVAAAAFVIYVSAFPGLQTAPALLEIAGAYLFSWGVGFVAIFAPQGIGVFEVVAAELLRGAAPLMGVTALFAGFRLIIMLSDAMAWTGMQLWSGFAVGQRGDLLGNQADQEDDH